MFQSDGNPTLYKNNGDFPLLINFEEKSMKILIDDNPNQIPDSSFISKEKESIHVKKMIEEITQASQSKFHSLFFNP